MRGRIGDLIAEITQRVTIQPAAGNNKTGEAMKVSNKLAAVLCAGTACVAGQASAELIVNGGVESGNTRLAFSRCCSQA